MAAALAALALGTMPRFLGAQERGIVALAEARAAAGVANRVLVIGAHPDDEDTQLIAWLARGHRAETAYLSLTRGDGGQNLIGNELGEALGVIRTEELLAARRIDGAHQYFTRAYDFGFSKTAAESFAHWPHDSLLGDVIKVVRAFRPQVMVSVFSGTPRDGHGQHQVAGILAREAYDLAGDTVRFPARVYGAPWTPLKFYRGARFSPEQGTLAINVGEYDSILGKSYAEIAAESRSQHKSQGFGTAPRRGASMDYLRREASRVNASTPAQSEHSLFDGIDTTRRVTAADNDRIALADAQVATEAVAARERVALGDSAAVQLNVYRHGVLDSAASHVVWVKGEHITQPYWLARPRVGDLFAFASDSIADDERVKESWIPVQVPIAGRAPIMVRTPPLYRYADPVRGEVQRPLATAPGVSVTFSRDVELARANTPLERAFQVTLRSSWPVAHTVSVALAVSASMRVDSSKRTVVLGPGATRTVIFRTTGTLTSGVHHVRAIARDGALIDTVGFVPIEYEHIDPQRMYRAADISLHALDVRLPAGVTVGYVEGVGDNVADGLRDLGVPVTLIDPADLPVADLSRFSTIIVGPRAYQANQNLIDNNAYLLDWTRRGGNLVVQYGQYEMQQPGVMPYPIALARPAARVTEENVPVTILDSASALLNVPNKITGRDFEGWLQERATYMPSAFDAHYQTVLAMHDPGEEPNRAAILTAPFGKGRYTYVTLALFRQIPAAVPGGARIFANLLR
ncbi:MAG: PIG-L family deacetylase [Gemmatimonadaceae bacterium]